MIIKGQQIEIVLQISILLDIKLNWNKNTEVVFKKAIVLFYAEGLGVSLRMI